jgi:glycosyltransferase involved in cell wall biosynthesis
VVTVSTIIPTRNRPQYLFDRAIASVLAQTFTDWECIVVGDDTDDFTVRLMKSLCADDPRFRFWNLPAGGDHSWHMGGVAAWNAGLAEARGEWRSYLGDDDEYEPRHHETLLSIAGDANFVYGLSVVIASDGTRTPRLFGNRDVDPLDIVQGSYIARSDLDVRARPAEPYVAWDATMLRHVLRGAHVERTKAIVHRYHPAPEHREWHRLP